MYGQISDFGRYFKKKESFIDNRTFQFHYRVTFGILIASSAIMMMSNLYGGPPIQCMVNGVPGGMMNTYCWIHGTFTIPSQLTGVKLGEDVPHPGVAPKSNRNRNEEEPGHVSWTNDGDEIRHAWYQWVTFILAFQAILCYIPHYLWKLAEGGKLSMLVQDMNNKNILDGIEQYNARRQAVVDYILRTFRSHNSYIYKFIFCEVLNLVNILFQIYLMDLFFGGMFTKYGADVLTATETAIEARDDPMNRVFPKVTKCTFHKYGPSGTIERQDGLCILAMNIINEKIYVFLWFWFIGLTVWTAVHLMIRVVSVASQYVRYLLFCNRVKSVNRNDVSSVLRKCYYGDWFILMQLAKHINPAIFHDVVLDLRDKLDAKRAANLQD